MKKIISLLLLCILSLSLVNGLQITTWGTSNNYQTLGQFPLYATYSNAPIILPPQASSGNGALLIAYPQLYYLANQDVTLRFKVMNSSYVIQTGDTVNCTIQIYNETGQYNTNQLASYSAATQDFTATIAKDNFRYGRTYGYILTCVNVELVSGFASNSFKISNLDNPIDAWYFVLCFIPILFGVFCLIGSLTLGQEHQVLKIFLYLFSLISTFISSWFASIILYELNTSFHEIIDAIGKTTWLCGLMFAVIIIYFLIYLFIKVIVSIAKQKEEKLEY